MNKPPFSSEETEQNLINTVNMLSGDIGSRSYTETKSLEKAAVFIEEQFRSYGCVPERQSFEINGNIYHNIFSEVKGTNPSEGIIVIGAHYDTVYGTPGADDNASGIAGVLELSRLFSKEPAQHTINFVAFTLEEPPFFRTRHMGSYIFAESLKRKNIKVKGMIALEMIGYFSNEKGAQYYPVPMFRWFYPKIGNFIAFVGNFHSRSFTNRFADKFRSASSMHFESLIGVSLVPGIDFSDHLSFWRFDYPAFMITDTAFYRNPNYHDPGDTADTLDYEKMAELVIGIYNTVRQI